ncbi:hypothetical protein ACQY0O_002300 [Thecaphora frezii]
MSKAPLVGSTLGRLAASESGVLFLAARLPRPNSDDRRRGANGRQAPQRHLSLGRRHGLCAPIHPAGAPSRLDDARRSLATVVASPSPSSLAGTSRNAEGAATAEAQRLQLQLQLLDRLFCSETGIDDPVWRSRIAHSARRLERCMARDARHPIDLLITGSSLSRLRDVVASLFDEPLRESTSSAQSDVDVLLHAFRRPAPDGSLLAFTIEYGPGAAQWLDETRLTLDRGWLVESNVRVRVVVDPSTSEAVQDMVYASDVAIFVTDNYALEQSLVRPASSGSSRSDTLDLVARFASKPNTHVLVNQLTPLDPAQYLAALEAAIGPAAAEQLSLASSSSLLPIVADQAVKANAALRQALASPDAQASAALWSEFSARFTASKVADVHRLVKDLASGPSAEQQLALQSARVVADHCLSDAISFIASALASFDRMVATSTALRAEDAAVVQEAKDRVWPSSSKRRARTALRRLRSWQPSASGSNSAVEDALSETAEAIASTMDRRLQWWKLIWKVDDVRAELEGVCASFAHSLESTLAYESGRLATLQAQQAQTVDKALQDLREIARKLEALPGTSRDVALFVNEAEAVGARETKVLTPQTLLEPIEQRREQLLRPGGPIDVLANEARKLAVTTYAALGATGAALGSAGTMGASLGSGPLSLEPSTAIALSLLICTAAGWRMQGRFAKIKARFWQDWDRLAEGLDCEVKEHLDTVLQRDVVGQSSFVASGLASLRTKWQSEVAAVEAQLRAHATRAEHRASGEQEGDVSMEGGKEAARAVVETNAAR